MAKRHTRKYSEWFLPYDVATEKICTLQYTGIGIYMISENGVLVYIGRSKKDVKGTLYRHFQKWTDKRVNKERSGIARVTYYGKNRMNYMCKVILCSDIEDACTLEEILIKRIEPRDNKLKASAFGHRYKKVIKSKFEEAGF